MKYFVVVVAFLAVWYIQTQSIDGSKQLHKTELENQYRYSQYCITEYRNQHILSTLAREYDQECSELQEFRGNIDDPELYAYAGARYLDGLDPTAINPEVQPLTKYFFGLSILWWGTALPTQLLFGVLCLILLYHLSRQVLGDYVALIPPTLLVLDPLFRDQLVRPFLDLSLTFWILLYTAFLTRIRYHSDWWWGGIVLGALALSKSFSYGILFAVISVIIFYLQQSPNLVRVLFKHFIVAAITYLAGYLMFFLHKHTLYDFAMLHYQILRLYKDYVPEYPKAEIFRIIFSGEWRTWWGDKGLIASPFYTIAWPISILTTLFAMLNKHIRGKLCIHLVWIAISLLFISMRLVFPRYLLPVLPSLYLTLVYVLHTLPNLLQLSHGSRSIREGK